ncbi:hypothetical protein TREES_T100014034 [Tupaia chinensis]|uniref:Uncharacterized protein n=1 Tax=Tupaia chinensis TaxID=246437 RepID=L9KN61_TUPCH|nr:hypothetical protein TREES_T100014034 [Tupaia chinensis]
MASCLGVLASEPKAPEVAQSSMGLYLLQFLQGFMQLVVQTTGQDLAVFSIPYIFLPVQELVWDLVLPWILNNSDRMFHLILNELSCPLGEVQLCFPQHHMRVSSPYTLVAVMAKAISCRLWMLVLSTLSTHKRCWNFSGITREMVVAQVAACRPLVKELISL